MPSGKTHDVVTVLLSVPVFAFAYKATADLGTCAAVTSGFLFGGLLFGPDLDTLSKQYKRWGIFRFLWYPYRAVIEHRSRWSHGILLGPIFRVVYFAGVVTLFSFLLAYLIALKIKGAELPQLSDTIGAWHNIFSWIELNFGQYALFYFFGGTWLGSVSHTLTDVLITFVKTGKVRNVF